MSYQGLTKTQFQTIISEAEIILYTGNCWALTLSMLFRCHGFNFSHEIIQQLFEEWRFSGVTGTQMERLITYFNRTHLDAKNWAMHSEENYASLLPDIEFLAPLEVFVSGHFVLVLGYQEATDEITYFEPWEGKIITQPRAEFDALDGGETAYLCKVY